MREEPKVFIGGGEQWDGSAREADADELEALAERFRSEELRAAAARQRKGDILNYQAEPGATADSGRHAGWA